MNVLRLISQLIGIETLRLTNQLKYNEAPYLKKMCGCCYSSSPPKTVSLHNYYNTHFKTSLESTLINIIKRVCKKQTEFLIVSSRLIPSTRTHWMSKLLFQQKRRVSLNSKPIPTNSIKITIILKSHKRTHRKQISHKQKITNSLEKKKKSENKLTLKFYQFNEWDR